MFEPADELMQLTDVIAADAVAVVTTTAQEAAGLAA